MTFSEWMEKYQRPKGVDEAHVRKEVWNAAIEATAEVSRQTDSIRGCCNKWEHCDCLDISTDRILTLKEGP